MENLPDALLTKVLAWTPMSCHGSLRGTSQTFRSIINSEEFQEVRLAEGFVESAIVFVTGPYGREDGQIWALIDGQWRRSPWTTGRDEFHATVVTRSSGKNSLLFIGTGSDTTSTKYRICDGDRSTLPPHIYEKYTPAVCHYGDCTVLAGGYNPNICEFLSSVKVCDPQAGQWTMLPSMPHQTSEAVAGVIGQKMYVAGGMNAGDNSSRLRHLQVYDMVTENWELGVPMPESLDVYSRVYGAVVNKMFHVVGRSSERKIHACFIYDAGRQIWTETAPISELECGGLGVRLPRKKVFRAFEHNGRLLVLHGYDFFRHGAPFSQRLRLQQLEDNREWSEILLSEFPDAFHPSVTGISEVWSIVLG